SSHRVLPDGCVDLLFATTAGAGFEGSVVGTMTRPLIVPPGPPTDYVAVRFRPGMASRLLGALPVAELTDARATVGALGLARGGALAVALDDAGDVRERVAALERPLLERVRDTPARADPVVAAVVERLTASGGAERIEALADFAGLSRQHLARRF